MPRIPPADRVSIGCGRTPWWPRPPSNANDAYRGSHVEGENMSQTQVTTCPKCSASIAPGAKFCPSCGNAISGIFSGGGTPLEGTAILSAEQQDTLFPILQEATLGDYDIYGELGRGGMAAVYLALDLALNRKVAIKTMLPDLV